MKKAFLSLAVVAAVAVPAMANDLTLNFMGDGDVYGMTRYHPTIGNAISKTYNGVPNTKTQYDAITKEQVPVPYWKDYSFTEKGVEVSFKTLNDAAGYLLSKSGKTSASELTCDGVAIIGSNTVAYKTDPEVTVSVPGGTISHIKIGFGGNSLGFTCPYSINGTAIEEFDGVSNALYIDYTPAQPVESIVLTCHTPQTLNRFIQYIDVTYTADLGGKEECGLAFSNTEANGVMGQAFTAPTLSNPNNLPITWTSSDEKVATVDADGNVTLVGPGTVSIVAATEGNDAYAAGDAKYTISVMGSANNIPQMMEYAPGANAQVVVNFPMTVMYANKGNAWVVDAEGNATEIHNTKNDDNTGGSTTIYKVGNVIPAGWTATNEFSIQKFWTGLPASENLQTVEVTYPEVETVNYQKDAFRVVTLKNVTFTTDTDATDVVKATVPSGDSYDFQNTFEIANNPAGTYDVTLVVNYMTRGTSAYTWLAPIKFAEVVEADPEFPAEIALTVNSDLNVTQGDEQGVYTISVKGETTEDKVVIKLEVPEGWDGFIGMTDVDYDPDFGLMKMKAYATEWISVEDLEGYGFKKVTELTFPADGEDHQGTLYLYKGDQADEANQIAIEVNASKAAVAVDPVFPETFNVVVPATDATLEVKQGYDQDVYTISVTGESKAETVTITIEIPEGWDGFVGMTDSEYEPEHQLFKKAAAAEWAPLATMLAYGMKEGNALTFDVDGKDYQGQLYLYKGDMVDMANQIALEVNIEKSAITAVEAIEAADADARYFNLQGAEVVNPGAGIYVKVANGKATKVIVK